MRMPTSTFAGIPVARTTLDEAAAEVIARAKAGTEPIAYRLVNSYTFALADHLPAYHRLLCSRGLNFPDGRPVVTFLNSLIPSSANFSQVRGPSLFVECLDRGRYQQIGHFFLGGTEELLDALVREANLLFPGVKICGTYSPPFRELTDDEIAEQDRIIARARPQIVWVGLGTPKQDFEAQRITDKLGVTTAGVGAAFDFVAGTKPEAPDWISRMSMEWFFRLATEPRRLWRRYVFGNSRFIYLVFRARVRALRDAPPRPNSSP